MSRGGSPTPARGESMGKRISDMRLAGKPIAADRKYKVAGWAPVAKGRRRARVGRGHAAPEARRPSPR